MTICVLCIFMLSYSIASHFKTTGIICELGLLCTLCDV